MSDDPDQPRGGRRPELDRESLRGLVSQPLGPTTGLPAIPTTGFGLLPTTGLPGPVLGPTTGLPAPILGPTTGHTTTAIIGADTATKPGRYVVETRQLTEFEVLDDGQVIVRRTETSGGEPERQA